jgi:uncharacterized protein YyaL (SSP411 family)
VVESLAPAIARYPTAFGHMLGNADLAIHGAIAVALVGADASSALAEVVADDYLPSLVLAGGAGAATEGIALLEGRGADVPTAYVCRAHACDVPTSNVAVLGEQLHAILAVPTASAPTSPP